MFHSLTAAMEMDSSNMTGPKQNICALPPIAEPERIVKRVEQLLGWCDAREAQLNSAEEERGGSGSLVKRPDRFPGKLDGLSSLSTRELCGARGTIKPVRSADKQSAEAERERRRLSGFEPREFTMSSGG